MIPARGNSKGIKNKNIVKINKKELICYTINFSKKLKSVSKVIVSTDAQRILKIAKKNGAHVPFIRPAKFAKDYSSDLDVFTHYINWLKKKKLSIPELIIHLRPTTPFRSLDIVNKAIKIMIKNKRISCLRSMKKSDFSPYKMWRINQTGKAIPVIKSKKELHSQARQKAPLTYNHIGFVDILRVKKTILKKTMTGDFVYPFIIEEKNLKKYVDIDNYNDLYKARNLNK